MKSVSKRLWMMALVVSSLMLFAGHEEEQAKAELTGYGDLLPSYLVGDIDLASTSVAAAPLSPLAPSVETNLFPMFAEAEGGPAEGEEPELVQEPVPPAALALSPPLKEVVKLVQSGLSEEVIMTYITNSADVFAVDSDTIVYLSDLGVSSTVITALIQHDSTPESVARRAGATAVQPLPPGVSMTTPATNVYPPSIRWSEAPGANIGASYTAAPEQTADQQTNTTATAPPEAESPTVSSFYDSLSPYGSWMYTPSYGYVWQPTVAVANPYWRPYADRGRWLWTDSGWYWYSDYSWGWAPFHYGRWCTYPRIGWVWVPDTLWGPSWVTWRYSTDYCGWAPLPPGSYWHHGYHGHGLYYHGSYVGAGFDFGFGVGWYTFVPTHRFCDRYPHRYYVPRHHAATVINKTIIVNNVNGNNNTIINNGVGYQKIARASRTPIPQLPVRHEPVSAPGKRERIESIGKAMGVVRPKIPVEITPAQAAAAPVRSSPTRAGSVGNALVSRNGDATRAPVPTSGARSALTSTTAGPIAPGGSPTTPAASGRSVRSGAAAPAEEKIPVVISRSPSRAQTRAPANSTTGAPTASADAKTQAKPGSGSAPVQNLARKPFSQPLVTGNNSSPEKTAPSAPASSGENGGFSIGRSVREARVNPAQTSDPQPQAAPASRPTPGANANASSRPAAPKSAAPAARSSGTPVQPFKPSFSAPAARPNPATPPATARPTPAPNNIPAARPATPAPSGGLRSFSQPSLPPMRTQIPSAPAPRPSAPANIPSYRGPIMSAPAPSAPVMRSAPAAPRAEPAARPNMGGGGSPTYSAPTSRPSPPSAPPSYRGGGGGDRSGGGGGGRRNGRD